MGLRLFKRTGKCFFYASLRTLMENNIPNLLNTIMQLDSVVIAFSGGVDSTLLAKLCSDYLKNKAIAVTIDGEINSKREMEQTKELASNVEIKHLYIEKKKFSMITISKIIVKIDATIVKD
ncbi:MAG: 7-cyano-7-deazaguanine synthase [bacterium]